MFWNQHVGVLKKRIIGRGTFTAAYMQCSSSIKLTEFSWNEHIKISCEEDAIRELRLSGRNDEMSLSQTKFVDVLLAACWFLCRSCPQSCWFWDLIFTNLSRCHHFPRRSRNAKNRILNICCCRFSHVRAPFTNSIFIFPLVNNKVYNKATGHVVDNPNANAVNVLSMSFVNILQQKCPTIVSFLYTGHNEPIMRLFFSCWLRVSDIWTSRGGAGVLNSSSFVARSDDLGHRKCAEHIAIPGLETFYRCPLRTTVKVQKHVWIWSRTLQPSSEQYS